MTPEFLKVTPLQFWQRQNYDMIYSNIIFPKSLTMTMIRYPQNNSYVFQHTNSNIPRTIYQTSIQIQLMFESVLWNKKPKDANDCSISTICSEMVIVRLPVSGKSKSIISRKVKITITIETSQVSSFCEYWYDMIVSIWFCSLLFHPVSIDHIFTKQK